MGPPPAKPFIGVSRQSRRNSHSGPGPVALLELAGRSQIYWARSSSGFVHGWRNEENGSGEGEGVRKKKHLLLPLFLLPLHLSPSVCLASPQPIQSHFNLPVNVLGMSRSITSLMLFIRVTGCELPCPWHLSHGATKPRGNIEWLLVHLGWDGEPLHGVLSR